MVEHATRLGHRCITVEIGSLSRALAASFVLPAWPLVNESMHELEE